MPEQSLELARERIDLGDTVDLVTEKLNADNGIVRSRGKNLNNISPYPELVADKVDVVSLVLKLYKLFNKIIAGFFHSRAK